MTNNFLRLIVENDFNDYEVVKDDLPDKNQDKPLQIKLRGIFIQTDKKNANDRTYKYEDMIKPVNSFINEFVNQGRALGELEHPDYAYINPNNSAIRITNLREIPDAKAWLGEAIVLASDPKHNIIGTPKGDILASLIQHGTKLGFSSRGVGDVDESSGTVKDYTLVTVDAVANPSIGIFAEGILESKKFMLDVHGDVIEVPYQKLEKKLESLPKKTDLKNKFIAEALTKFIKDISIR